MTSTPDAFELPILVEPSDIDALGHANNVTYVRWVQDAAVAHWRAAAPATEQDRLVWVLLRHEIDYRQPAYEGDSIVAQTWVGSATRLRFERLTEIRRAKDGAVLASSRTVWCPLDAVTGKPTAVSPEIRALFSSGAGSVKAG